MEQRNDQAGLEHIPSFPLNNKACSEGEQQALQEWGHTRPGGGTTVGRSK